MKKTSIVSQIFLAAGSLIFLLFLTGCGQDKVKLDITPDGLFEKMSGNPALQGTYTGESFCWTAASRMNQFVDNYELTKDTEWLDAGVRYFDFLLGKRHTDPEGYKGWIGPYIYDKENYWQDALVGDAVIFAGILDFSMFVLEEKKLKLKYGDRAYSYVETAKKDLFEKWEKRGCWYVDGPYGGHITYSYFFKPGNIKEWVYAPDVSRAGLSHPFNKQMDVAEVALQIHRITGEKRYWDIAEKIYFTAKSRFQYFDDHYCWNYWEPLYPGDIVFDKDTTKHWVGVHDWRSGYQSSEVNKIVKAYHYGIVFDEKDIQRIINTNLNVMWNKDRENPQFINSNGLGAERDTIWKASFQRLYGHSNEFRNQGQLWTGLLEFDQTIRDLYELRFKDRKDSPEYMLYEKTILANPPQFKRKHAKADVIVPEVNFTECRDLYTAAVIPHIVPEDGHSFIICGSWNPGLLQVDLYTLKGEKVAGLFEGNVKPGFSMMKWDGKFPAEKTEIKGEYRIRWTINGGYREFPVVI